jgi:hypothetical protein
MARRQCRGPYHGLSGGVMLGIRSTNDKSQSQSLTPLETIPGPAPALGSEQHLWIN